MHSLRDDIAIARDIKRGDQKAFDELYLKYSRWLYDMSLIRCGFDHFEAEDIVQEAFVKLWEAKKDIMPERPISNYLFTIMVNTTLDKVQKKKTYKKHLQFYQVGEPFLEAPDIKDNELAQKLLKAIDQIAGPSARHAVKRYYMDGMTYKEIVEETGLKIGTLRIYVRRGLEALQKIVKKKD